MDLSTIRRPLVQEATDLTRWLLEAIEEPHPRPLTTILPTELVVRGSTDRTCSVYQRSGRDFAVDDIDMVSLGEAATTPSRENATDHGTVPAAPLPGSTNATGE
jgi:hypothetical protein